MPWGRRRCCRGYKGTRLALSVFLNVRKYNSNCYHHSINWDSGAHGTTSNENKRHTSLTEYLNLRLELRVECTRRTLFLQRMMET